MLIARHVHEIGNYNNTIFIPCGNAPHKNNLAPYDYRATMLEDAIKQEPGFIMSDIEGTWANEGKKSYTINTYRYFIDRLGDNIRWLIGSDTLPLLKTWHDFAAIQKEMRFAVITRLTGESVDLHNLAKELGVDCEFYDEYQHLVSSTAVRNRIAEGKSIRWLVPDSAEKFIAEHKLYQNTER